MREFISGAWHLLDGWGRVASGLLLASALFSLVPLITEPGWVHALDLVEAVLVFVSVTALMVLAELFKRQLAKDLMFRPLTRLGSDVMKGIAESENLSVMVHIAGDSYMIELVGVQDEHE